MRDIQSGIYLITNTTNGKVYVGQSVNLQKRITQHKWVAFNKTRYEHLYHAMKKYGLEVFTFEVLEICDKQFLDDREKFWIERYESWNPDKGYNKTYGGQAFKATKEFRDTMSQVRKAWLDADPSRIEDIRKVTVQQWKDPQGRLKKMQGITSPEVLEKASLKSKENWNNISYRQKRTESFQKTIGTETFHQNKKEGWQVFAETNKNSKWITITNGIKNSRILVKEGEEPQPPEGWRVGYTENRLKYK